MSASKYDYASSKLDECLDEHISNLQEADRLRKQIMDLENKQNELIKTNQENERTLAKRVGTKGSFTGMHVVFAKQNSFNGIWDKLDIREIVK